MGKYTICELQQMLEERQTALQELTRQRIEKLNELKQIDAQIEELSGEAVSDIVSNVTIPKPDKSTRKKSTGRKTSIDYAKEVLKKHPDGLLLDDLAVAVVKAGYETKSEKFSNTLYQSLYKNDEIIRNSDGRYVLSQE